MTTAMRHGRGDPAAHLPLAPAIAERFASLRRLIGGTPLIEVRCRYQGRRFSVYAKHEIINFTGSIKDRMALHILQEAYRRGDLQPGWIIAEATSGNTGIAFAAIGRALGHPVQIYMPDWMSQERVLLLGSLGASITPISHDQGGFLGSIRAADDFAIRQANVFLPHQFANGDNVEAHYRTTGPEILDQLQQLGLEPTHFVAGVGTGGTVAGVGRLFRERVPGVRVHPLEPANSPTMRTGICSGKHRIAGISDEFVPPILDLRELDEIVDVWDGDAILMAQKLASKLGLGVGISSGANLLGAIRLAAEHGPGAVVATIFPDSNKKYLSTDLCKDEPVRDDYLSPQVELEDLRVVSARV